MTVRVDSDDRVGKVGEMSQIRQALPQLDGSVFLTDGGMETWLVFLEGVELPCFASFPLLSDPGGRERMERYMAPFLQTAVDRGVGFILGTPTWRANPDWGAQLGYSSAALRQVNHEAVAWAKGIRDAAGPTPTRIVIEGLIGPRGDGYKVELKMSPSDAAAYHLPQVEAFAESGADMVTALTMTYADEAIGVVRAAQAVSIPVAISFTLETDGRLPSGQTLAAAIESVDQATHDRPAYYMINCAHPMHFAEVVGHSARWRERIIGLRANASTMSHAELDAATELDIGDPADLGRRYRALRERMPRLSVLGGCCGTDHRHIVAICEACLPE